MLPTYRRVTGTFDEMFSDDGVPRADWNHAAVTFDALGLEELRARSEQSARLLEDDGVTYAGTDNVAAPNRGRRSWDLDPIPVFLDSSEWTRIAAGIVQRAELLNLLLTDLYGPRTLIRHGLVPPEVIFDDPSFLRECDQIRLPTTQQLFTCAIDLARDPDGDFIVLGDRTQAPSGAGYALENRSVVSRVFSNLYRESGVQRVEPYFRTLRAALQGVAQTGTDNPRIVILTPGPLSETAFEHAYLATQLGISLVEGKDLVAQDGGVWMRTLGRLERVDVILRRVDASYCDPLELRSDSRLGVAGLVETCRTGGVSVVNTLGSGVLENPALLSFLPRLAPALLGESLLLPTVPTWWCGDAIERQHVSANLDRLLVHSTNRRESDQYIRGWELSTQELDTLRRRIDSSPHQWVAQEMIEYASVPTLAADGLEGRRASLRTFLVARGDSYLPMPGGLTRAAALMESRSVSNRSGGLSKDTWVLASEPERLGNFWLKPGPTVTAQAPEESMSTRAAENFFWLGRYAERAESVLRLLRVTQDRRNDFATNADRAGHACLLVLYEALRSISDPSATTLMQAAVDEQRPGTLAHAVRRMLDASHAVRDQLGSDTWLALGRLDRELAELAAPTTDWQTTAQQPLSSIMESLLAFGGLASETMIRDPGWLLMDVGRHLERAIQLTLLLEATVTSAASTPTDSLLMESVLTASESIITYRRRYRAQAQTETLLDLLLLDPANPRSLRFQIASITGHLAMLPPTTSPLAQDTLEELVKEASNGIDQLRTADLASTDATGRRGELVAFLTSHLDLLHRIADAVSANHFAHQPEQHGLLTAYSFTANTRHPGVY